MTTASLSGRKVLLIVGGGIAAYKALELTRLMKKAGAEVMSVLTAAGAEFVTPMSLAALTGQPVRQALDACAIDRRQPAGQPLPAARDDHQPPSRVRPDLVRPRGRPGRGLHRPRPS